MSNPPRWRQLTAARARAIKAGDGAEEERLQVEIRAERLADHVTKVVESFPPLTRDQLDKLAAILRSAPVDRDDAA